MAFVDVMRGLAVLFMMVLHTAHGWLQPGARDGAGWAWITGFGGMAAPLFFLLAGAGLGLQWQSSAASLDRAKLGAAVGRGMSLVVLGYALRVQMWLIDGGAISQPWKWPAAGCLIGGYVLAYLACERLSRRQAHVTRFAAAAAALCCLGLWGVGRVEPSKIEGLLRVDVLQGIGASLVLLHLLTARAHTAAGKVALAGAFAVAVAGLTHAARGALPGPLPQPLAGYLAQWPIEPGARPAGMFPMLPWAAYTGVGAALGVYWADAQARGQLTARVMGLAAAGVLLSLTTRETSPAVFALIERFPPLVHPARVLYRVGICLALSAVALPLSHAFSPLRRPLATLGAASLLVYWVHLEFAFGAAAAEIRHRLDYTSWWTGLGLLTLAMWGVAWLRGWLRQRPRSQPSAA